MTALQPEKHRALAVGALCHGTGDESDFNFRLLFDASPIPMWVYSAATLRFLEVNQAAQEHYGYSRQEFLSLSLADIRPAEDVARLLQDLARPRTDGYDIGEWRHCLKSGELIDVEVRSRNIRFSGLECRVGIVNDITIRKRRDHLLRLSEARYRQIVETANEGIWTSDTVGRALFVNQRMADMLGYQPEEIIGKRATDFAREDFVPAVEAGLERRQRGGSDRYTIRLRRRNGDDFWALVSASPILDAEGNFTATLAMVTDITEQKQSEEKIQFQAHLLDTVGQAVIAVDLDGSVRYWNRYAESLYGWSATEAVGSNISKLMVPERQHPQASEVKVRLGKGDPWSEEFQARRRDGTVFPAHVTNAPLQDATGALTGMVSVSIDLTIQKRLHDQLAQQEKLASIGELIAGVAHEINNPLAVISGQAQLLQMHPEPQVQADAVAIRDMAERAARIMKSLRSYARPSDGTAAARGSLGSLNEVVISALDVIAYKLRVTKVSLHLELAEDLPLVPMNAGEIEQVIVNVLSNAEHAVRERSLEDRNVWIRTAIDPTVQRITFSIEDTGYGMSKEVRGRIFDPFFTTKGMEEGTGLGLYISHSIITAHEGIFSVESVPGTGTTFTIALPIGESFSSSDR